MSYLDIGHLILQLVHKHVSLLEKNGLANSCTRKIIKKYLISGTKV